MGSGSGGGSGGVGMGIINRADFTDVDELNITITISGNGQRLPFGSGGAKHGAGSAANGRGGERGHNVSIAKANGTNIIKAYGGGGGTGGMAWLHPDYWGWEGSQVRGYYWNSSGNGQQNAVYFSGGAAGWVKYENNVAAVPMGHIGWSTEGTWSDDSHGGYPINKNGSINASTGFAGGVPHHELHSSVLGSLSADYGKGGNGGNEGSNDGHGGNGGVAVVFQYFS